MYTCILRLNIKQSKMFSINKIGHAMHDLDPVFENFSRTSYLEKIKHTFGKIISREGPIYKEYKKTN